MTLHDEKTKPESEILRADVQKLVRMLAHQRPSYGFKKDAYHSFLEEFIRPVFGEPDKHGNFIKTIYGLNEEHPRIAYMAHHDTVHKNNVYNSQAVKYYHDKYNDLYLCVSNQDIPHVKMTVNQWDYKTKKSIPVQKTRPDTLHDLYSSCLGADCTTGVWLILEMIESGCPGVYVIHNDEEVGCRGSSAITADYEALSKEEQAKHWISKVDIAMSFDRYGETSIITHQTGVRTASDDFAKRLSDILDPYLYAKERLGLEADDGGSYTDSNEYSSLISECTNLSVGYYDQHGVNEKQNVSYLLILRDALIEKAMDLNDPNVLAASRDPSVYESAYGNYGGYGSYYGYGYSNYDSRNDTRPVTMGNRSSNAFEWPLYDEESRKADIIGQQMIPIEDRLQKSIRGEFEKHGSLLSSDETIDSLAEWMELYPYLVASLLQNSGVKVSEFVLNLKREAIRRQRFQKYEDLFDKTSSGVDDDDIPFDVANVSGLIDPNTKLIPDFRSIVEKHVSNTVVVENEIEG